MLNGDHLEEMNECDIKEETVNPCRNNARVDTSSNDKGGHDKDLGVWCILKQCLNISIINRLLFSSK